MDAVAATGAWKRVRALLERLASPVWTGGFGVFTIVVSVVSIYFAYVSIADARSQAEKIEAIRSRAADQTRQLEELAARTSTRYVAEFPRNLPEIVALLEKAHARVLIATDFAGYGIFSARSSYEAYEAAISSLAQRRIPVEMVILGPEQQARQRQEQFGAAMRESPRFDRKRLGDDRIADLERRYAPGSRIETWERFGAALDAAERDAQGRITPCVKLRRAKARFPLFLWIVDDTTALFSIANLQAGTVSETTFTTSEHRLVQQLKNVFESYRSGEG